MEVSKAQLCPVCHGKGQVPYNFYDVQVTGMEPANTAVNTFPVSCRGCVGKGWIVITEQISVVSSGNTTTMRFVPTGDVYAAGDLQGTLGDGSVVRYRSGYPTQADLTCTNSR